MGWKQEGRLLVPDGDDSVETETKNDERVTPGGLVVEGEPAPTHVPRQIRRLVAKMEKKAKKKESRVATRAMLKARWLPLLKPKTNILRENKGEESIG